MCTEPSKWSIWWSYSCLIGVVSHYNNTEMRSQFCDIFYTDLELLVLFALFKVELLFRIKSILRTNFFAWDQNKYLPRLFSTRARFYGQIALNIEFELSDETLNWLKTVKLLQTTNKLSSLNSCRKNVPSKHNFFFSIFKPKTTFPNTSDVKFNS